jgi:three-Cys-motif partner protein
MDDFDSHLDPSLLEDIGPWSERKHAIVQEYATVYSQIMDNAAKRVSRFSHDYIDGYASAGLSRRRSTNEVITGTALNSLTITPPFDHYTFVELNAEKHAVLNGFVSARQDVTVLNADANVVLPRDVFPTFSFDSYRRAFCLLDPYKHKHLDWATIEAAGKTKAIDLLLHFPTMTMNRGALHRDGDVAPDEADALTRFWGDESWYDAAYPKRPGLFEEMREKATDLDFARAFCQRLRTVGGFLDTSRPIPMLNSKGATLYYLIFALPHASAVRAAKSVEKFFIENPRATERRRPVKRLRDTG